MFASARDTDTSGRYPVNVLLYLRSKRTLIRTQRENTHFTVRKTACKVFHITGRILYTGR